MANIENSISGVTLVGSADADSIYNSGSNVVINAGAGKDTIYNEGDNVSITGGEGNDRLRLNFKRTYNRMTTRFMIKQR